MAGAGLKVTNSSYKVNLLHLQNGETKAGKFFTQNFKSNVNVVKTDVLDYSERSLSNILFEGIFNYILVDKTSIWFLHALSK